MRVLDVDFVADDAIQPCLSVGDIRFSQSAAYNIGPNIGPNASWLSITPPKKIKMIHQVKDVNIQTVIGNAGGYVGLFLGMCHFFILFASRFGIILKHYHQLLNDKIIPLFL